MDNCVYFDAYKKIRPIMTLDFFSSLKKVIILKNIALLASIGLKRII